MQAQEIKDQLNSLISEAYPVDPSLAIRLDEIYRWVKDVKPGALTNKKFVMAFLLQLVSDSEVWLAVKSLPSDAAQQAAFELMTPAERYWYSYLFPKWLSETDRKFHIWKKKLMAGDFYPADDRLFDRSRLTFSSVKILLLYSAILPIFLWQLTPSLVTVNSSRSAFKSLLFPISFLLKNIISGNRVCKLGGLTEDYF